MALFDAATDRRSREHVDLVEAVRAGTIVAHDAKAYQRWRADVNRQTPDANARTLQQLLRDAGGNVERGGLEFRH